MTLSKTFQQIQERNLADLEAAFRTVMRPAPRLSISEWADDTRRLSSEASSSPGKWRTSRAEYQRGIMDAVKDPATEKVVVMKGSQVGWTEIICNIVGYFVHHDPSPILVIQPSLEMAQAWSKERLAPMIRDTPALKSKFKESRARDSGNTLRHKEYAGGYVAIIGANAPSGLASRPIRIVLADETDRFPVSAGTEGDPLKLASKRQSTFWNRKMLAGSTPTIKGISPIEREYENSDKRRFFVPCPHCDTPQDLRWEQVKWDKAGDDHRPDSAHYLCEHCGTLWTDSERWQAISKGHWKATAPFSGLAGFHLSQLYSPWIKLEAIVREFLEAKGRPELLQVFVNTALGETWEEQGETVDATGLRAHVEDYDDGAMPDGAHYATAGVDVQDDRLEVEIVAWGDGDESWGLGYWVLYGDPAQATVWGELDEILLDRYWTETGRLIKVRAVCVDTGGHHAAQVYKFCGERLRRGVYAIKGAAGPRPIWPKRASRTKQKENMWLVGVDTAKDAVYGRFKITEPGPGYCHVPASYDDEWFDQAVSETVVTRYREGRPYRVWTIPPGRRNEALDCRVYALAARMSLSQKQTRPSRIVADSVEEKSRVEQAIVASTQSRRTRGVRSKGIRR